MPSERERNPEVKKMDTCEDESLVKELRSAISDVIDEAPLFSEYFYLLLWLKARKMKVKEAEKAIRNSWQWRKQNNLLDVEELEPALKEEYLKFLPVDKNGVDKNGVLIVQMSIGSWKTNGFIEKFGKQEFIRLLSMEFLKAEKKVLEFHQEQQLSVSRNSNEQKTVRSKGTTIILNFAQFSMWNSVSLAGINVGMECTKIFSNYFCGHVENVILVNVNSVVTSLMKPFLSLLNGVPIEIYGTDSDTWRPKLYAMIDPSQLLPSYGGTKRAEEKMEGDQNII